MPDWMKHKLESRLQREINNFRYAVDTTLMAESEEELKSLLIKVKEREKAGLKQHSNNKVHGMWSHQFMANRWGRQWKQWETIFLGSKITVDGDCSNEIKRCLLLGRKAMINLDSILKKQRHSFTDKGPCSQSCGFSSNNVWMWDLDHKEIWAPENWCFELWFGENSWEALGLQGDPTSQS